MISSHKSDVHPIGNPGNSLTLPGTVAVRAGSEVPPAAARPIVAAG